MNKSRSNLANLIALLICRLVGFVIKAVSILYFFISLKFIFFIPIFFVFSLVFIIYSHYLEVVLFFS